ncbi:MAG TPA: Hin recombinase [Candidatus Atribacteria bacterium]|nr:Hin recombinase [Candidatus Atribacteria bacterium]
MAEAKLTIEEIEKIQQLLEKGYTAKELAKKYGVDRSTIYRQVKYRYSAKRMPLEVKNKIIKKIKEGYTKAEAAQMYNVPLSTVLWFTKGLPSIRHEGTHIIRKHGIELLRRLLRDGCLVSNFVPATVRNLQRHFPMIRSARFKNRTIFYLEGREEETIEAFFRENPSRVINYSSIEELAFLLGVKISKKEQKNLLEKYRKKRETYLRSIRLIQLTLNHFCDEEDIEWAKPSFRLMPRRKNFEVIGEGK